MTLQDLLLEGRCAEISDFQAADIEKGSTGQQGETLQAVKSMKSAVQWHRKPGSTMKCRGCGGIFPHKDRPCLAKGKLCHKCGKQNHFAKFCMSQAQVNAKRKSVGKNAIFILSKLGKQVIQNDQSILTL